MPGGKPHSKKHKNDLMKNNLTVLRGIWGMAVNWRESLLVRQAFSSRFVRLSNERSISAVKMSGHGRFKRKLGNSRKSGLPRILKSDT
jgi:hypothetical protein